MTDMIPYEKRLVGHETLETVDGRDLHAGLAIGKDYSSWAKAQIKRAQLTENTDYIVFTQKGERENQGLTRIEYFFTFDAAKHVALMSGSKKGKEIREYFIACEKALREQPVTRGDLLVHMAEAYRLQEQKILAIEAEQRRQDRALIAQQAQLIETYEASHRAETKADMALDETRRMTLEEFVLVNGLERQFPLTRSAAYAAWLTQFCATYNQRVDKAPVLGKHWDRENAYPIQALAAWLRHERTKPQQIALVHRG